MTDTWANGLERVYLMIRKRGIRSVSVLSFCESAGVTSICRTIAEQSALAGSATMLIDVAGGANAEDDHGSCSWELISGDIVSDVHRYDRMILRHDAAGWRRYGNFELTREALETVVERYDLSIFDLPPLTGATELASRAIAAACETLLFVCPLGASRSAIDKTLRSLQEDGVQVGAIIWNDPRGMSSAMQFALFAGRWLRTGRRFNASGPSRSTPVSRAEWS